LMRGQAEGQASETPSALAEIYYSLIHTYDTQLCQTQLYQTQLYKF
jgi:hypothetical protein